MENFNIWSIAPVVTVEQAAFLALDLNPDGYGEVDTPQNVKSMLNILANSINAGNLNVNLICKADKVRWGHNCADPDLYFYQPTPDRDYGVDIRFYRLPDWSMSTINTDDLKVWLSELKLRPSVFFGSEQDIPGYLKASHDHYSNKLAAAIAAWMAISSGNHEENDNKTVKQKIIGWLTKNAALYGLNKADGTPNTEAIENQIAKVVNWDTRE